MQLQPFAADLADAGAVVIRSSGAPMVTREEDGSYVVEIGKVAVVLDADQLRAVVVGWLVALGDDPRGVDLDAMEMAAALTLDRARTTVAVRHAEGETLADQLD